MKINNYLLRIFICSLSSCFCGQAFSQADTPVPIDQSVVRVEAEDGLLVNTEIATTLAGYSGTGYVTGFDSGDDLDDRVQILVDVPETAVYTLILGYSGEYGDKINNLSINETVQQIDFPASTGFAEVNVGEITLTEGVNTLEISENWGWFHFDYFEFQAIVGQPPVVMAPDDIFIHDEDQDGEVVHLAGSATDADGTIASYSWKLSDGTEIGTTAAIDHSFPFGTHTVIFSATDNDGNERSDVMLVAIADLKNNGHNRIKISNGQELFMSGINIAWSENSNFARDLVNFDETVWTGIFDAIEGAGGNACRWWLHTNGSASPLFGADGSVSGLNSQSIGNMKKALDMAYERGIVISMCLWSFDMLQNQGQNTDFTRALLEDAAKTQSYIDNALIPILQEIGDHPAVMSWEIFNEPEGMTSDLNGWANNLTEMQYVQRFVNLTAGAIHREVPTALVSNGSWSFQASSDANGFYDYYSDERLIASGGDPDGTLDFIQVHYYDHFSENASPFHNPASLWGIDKPIVIGEFPARGIEGLTAVESFERLYQLGYAGAMGWSWSDVNFGGFAGAAPGIQNLYDKYPEDIVITRVTAVVDLLGNEEQIRLYPNPTETSITIELKHQSILTYEVIDMKGRILIKGDMKGTKSIQLNDIPSGVYLLKLSGKDKIIDRRFIKL